MSGPGALSWAGAAAAVFSVSAIGVSLLRRWATARQILDVPNARSSHTLPTPRGAGLVLVVVTFLGAMAGVAVGAVVLTAPLLWVWVGALAVALVSWLEDVRRVPLPVRLCVHVVAAAVVVWAVDGSRDLVLPLVGDVRLSWAAPALGVLWIVGLANAFNFMDGVDGIAGGQALVAALAWMALTANQPGLRWIAMLVAAGSLGFLMHNWHPATIFMGDTGAIFLGFVLAVLPLLARGHDARLSFAGLLVVWPFVFDTTFTLLRRLRRRENVFAAHRSHLYQRLVIASWSHPAASLLYAALALLGAGLARLWVAQGESVAVFVSVTIGVAAVGLWLATIICERRSQRRLCGS
jgi:UDP-N-acetylmuramyl pentapeptide phosphotransferase/UDP-N-acetylglucosamine-1-phosphate transferase